MAFYLQLPRLWSLFSIKILNELLGKSYAMGAFYNFYFEKVNLKVAWDLPTTNPMISKPTARIKPLVRKSWQILTLL